jgi:DNA-binding transcriptional LysR family regulator
LTLDQLRIFLEVARREHVTDAARSLNLTQSAVSAAVAALEARHGVRLFDRIGRRIELTALGRRFVPEAEAVLARAEAAAAVLSDLGEAIAGPLRVRASQTVASTWLPPRLVELHRQHPGILIAFAVGNTREVARAVVDGTADVGVVEGAADDPRLERRIVADDTLVLVVGTGHPFARRAKIAADEFTRTPWILREEGSGTRGEFEAHLALLGLRLADLEVALELPSNEAVLSAIAAGGYATVLSRRTVEAALGTGRLAAIDLGIPPRRFVALRHRERQPTRQAAALFDLLAEGGDAPRQDRAS